MLTQKHAVKFVFQRSHRVQPLQPKEILIFHRHHQHHVLSHLHHRQDHNHHGLNQIHAMNADQYGK